MSKSKEEKTSQWIINLIQKELDEGFQALEKARKILDNFDGERMTNSAKEIFLYVKQRDEKVVS